jgi:MerR family transcriptional regulator, light-induced transcriptional regulator
MTNNDLMLTSSQAASLIQVHESSMKRWTNEGRLLPSNTKGGHRRIALPTLLEFIRKERPEGSLLRFAPFEEETAHAALACRERNNFLPLTDLIVKFCDTQPPSYLVELVRYLQIAFEIPITRTFDLGLAEALRRIGREWSLGVRTIAHEHRFTQKVLDSLYGLRNADSDFKNKEAPLALVGSAENCHHEIGAMFVRLTLEEAGWRVCYLGANVPFDEYAGIQAELKASMVAISFVPPLVSADAMRCAGILGRQYQLETPYHLVMGGAGIRTEDFDKDRWPFLGLRIAKDTESLMEWAKGRLQKDVLLRKGKV